jgi:PAS domain S-box-containing protein
MSENHTQSTALHEQFSESEYLRSIIQTTTDGFLVVGQDRKIVDVNEAYCTMVGYSREELLSMHIEDLDAAETIENINLRIEKMVRDGAARFETRHYRKDRSVIYLEVSASCMRNYDNRIISFCRDITERKNAEYKLQRNESSLKLAQQIGRFGNWELDLHNNVLYWSDQIYKIFEIDKELFRASYDEFLDLIHPDDKITVNNAYNESLRTKKPYKIEHRLLMKDGRIKYVMEDCETEFDGDGLAIISRGTIRDITDRKEIELKLEESKENLELALAAANAGTWVWNIETNEMQWSDEFIRIFDFDTSVLPCLDSWKTRIHKDDVQTAVIRLQNAIDNGTYLDSDYRIVLRNKSIRWIRSVGMATYKNGRPVRMGGLCIDNTERKNTEQQLLDSEIRFRALIENSADAISLVDSKGNVMYDSPSYSRIMGYTNAERMGRNAFQLVHPDDRELLNGYFRKILELGGKSDLPPIRVLHKDGTWHWIEGIANNLINVQSVNGIVVNFRDITERRRTEDALHNAQKLESLGILAGGIAHDFNNLLGGIYGCIDLAAETAKDRDTLLYLKKAHTSIDRARSLTHQLLTFAKGGTPVKAPGNMITVVQETITFALSGSNVSATFQFPEFVSICEFDKNQISQVLDNVVINAIQAMPDGGKIDVCVENMFFDIQWHGSLPAGNYVRVSIRDYGVGISKENLPRIFDPFFTTKPKGYGLGLATCYSIIKRHDGYIDVESEERVGTIFHIYLPAFSEYADNDDIEGVVLHKGSGLFIIMDDEDIMADILRGMLSAFGYSVICTKNGLEVLSAYNDEIHEGRRPVGMIVDLTIPGGMGGKETIAEIRKFDSEIIVFVASGYAEDPVMADPEKFGFTSSICKPFKKRDLAKLLNKYLPGDRDE